MTDTPILNSRASAFRTAIDRFLEKNGACLDNAEQKVKKLLAATHVLKATHPQAGRGYDLAECNLRVRPAELPRRVEIGTHLLEEPFTSDVAVGDAAALPPCQFFKLKVDGLRLLDWFLQDDADLRAILNDY
jgi:hypothetical protein